MMQKLRNPKNVKLISLFVAAIFVLGCFALSVTQSGVGKSAFAASSESAIGVVNYQMLVAQSPDLNDVNTAMNKEIEAAHKAMIEAEKTYNTLVDAFVKDFGSYHMTYSSSQDLDGLINHIFRIL